MDFEFSLVILVAILVIWFLSAAIRIVREYERLVVFRLGHLIGARGPGIVLVIPVLDTVELVNLRIVTMDVPSQEVITKDNVTCRVNAVVYYRVVDPSRTIVNVDNYPVATAELAQTTLRSVVGQAELDELLAERDRLNLHIQSILDDGTDPWGIKVTSVEIKDVVIPDDLLQAISRQAEAERQRRALVIHADGERQAAERISQAAQILSRYPGGLTLRTLRVLPELAANPGNLVAFPLPMELASLLGGNVQGAGSAPPPDLSDLDDEELDELLPGDLGELGEAGGAENGDAEDAKDPDAAAEDLPSSLREREDLAPDDPPGLQAGDDGEQDESEKSDNG